MVHDTLAARWIDDLIVRVRQGPQVRPDAVVRGRARVEEGAPWPEAEIAAILVDAALARNREGYGDDRCSPYTASWAVRGSVVESRCQSQAKRPT
jgi:hypothetical protein